MNDTRNADRTRLYDLTVASIRPLGEDGIALRLSAGAQRARFDFQPGQYLTLELDVDGDTVRRPYSISSTPRDEHLEVGIRQVPGGRFSGAARLLRPGDRVRSLQPQGRFCPTGTGSGRQLLLVAAGSGITPCLSIMQSTLTEDADAHVTLLYGNRTLASMMYRDELAALKDRYTDRLMIDYLLSREEIHGAESGRRIDAAYLGWLHEAGQLDVARYDEAFLCGPGNLADEIGTILARFGFPEAAIHQERFLPSPDRRAGEAAASQPVDAARDGNDRNVTARAEPTTRGDGSVRVTLDGFQHVFDIDREHETVLAAANRHGIELPYSCAGGMCCSCRCRVVEGEVSMAANYSLQPWELERGFVLACQSRSLQRDLVLDFDAQ